MNEQYRIVHTIKEENDKNDRGSYYLQFVDYVVANEGDEPFELVKSSIKLKTGQIFCDALNISNKKNLELFEITDETTVDYMQYVDFLKSICEAISNEAMMFCYELYSEFYQTGRAKDAYVPTMSVRLELDCSEEGWLVEYFYFEDFENLLVYDFYSAIKERRAIKCCAGCQTFFLTENRTDQLYCNAKCKVDAKNERSRSFYAANDDAERLKRRIAARLEQRTSIKNEALREDRIQVHKAFLAEAKQWKKRIKAGEPVFDEYVAWLHKQDEIYSRMY